MSRALNLAGHRLVQQPDGSWHNVPFPFDFDVCRTPESACYGGDGLLRCTFCWQAAKAPPTTTLQAGPGHIGDGHEVLTQRPKG